MTTEPLYESNEPASNERVANALEAARMSADKTVWDLSELEETWARRRARMASLAGRVDRTGMTRPRRNPEEKAWLEARGELPPTIEIDTPLNEQGSTPRPSRKNAL
jgi:hypothetical protein